MNVKFFHFLLHVLRKESSFQEWRQIFVSSTVKFPSIGLCTWAVENLVDLCIFRKPAQAIWPQPSYNYPAKWNRLRNIPTCRRSVSRLRCILQPVGKKSLLMRYRYPPGLYQLWYKLSFSEASYMCQSGYQLHLIRPKLSGKQPINQWTHRAARRQSLLRSPLGQKQHSSRAFCRTHAPLSNSWYSQAARS